MPTVLHINTRADHGGATHAALLLHHALNRLSGVSSTYLTGRGVAEDADIVALGVPRWKLYANVIAFRLFGLDGPLNRRHWQDMEPLIEAADIVHLHNVHGYYMPYSVLERILSSKPVVWTLHDYWLATGRRGAPRLPFWRQSWVERLWPWGGYDYPLTLFDRSKAKAARLTKLLNRHHPVLVVPTHDMKERLAVMGILDAQVIHHGIFSDPSPNLTTRRIDLRRRLGWPETQRIMLFVATTIDTLKGWRVLERALDRLRNPEQWHLMIVGNDRKGIVRVSSYPVRTTLLGPRTRSEVMAYFRAADLYVNPTLAETFGLTCLEALGEGTDVVCSDLSVLQEIAGSAATFFSVGSSESLAATLNSYRSGSEAAQSARAELVRERFSTQGMTERYRALYDIVPLDPSSTVTSSK